MPNAKRPEPTQARLKELFNYDPETGVFTNLQARGRYAKIGSPAGHLRSDGYRQISVDSRLCRASRLAYIFMTGSPPIEEVDHINRNPSDNSWANLRPASRSENLSNTRMRSDNKSGFRGVCWDKRHRKWKAYARGGGPLVNLGHFDTPEEAAAVADAWRKEHHGEFYSCPQPQDPLPPKP